MLHRKQSRCHRFPARPWLARLRHSLVQQFSPPASQANVPRCATVLDQTLVCAESSPGEIAGDCANVPSSKAFPSSKICRGASSESKRERAGADGSASAERAHLTTPFAGEDLVRVHRTIQAVVHGCCGDASVFRRRKLVSWCLLVLVQPWCKHLQADLDSAEGGQELSQPLRRRVFFYSCFVLFVSLFGNGG